MVREITARRGIELVERKAGGKEATVNKLEFSPMMIALLETAAEREQSNYASRPAADAIGDSARWFVDNGYVNAKRLARISFVK